MTQASSVIKANYTRDAKAAKGSTRYYAQRADAHGDRQHREAFTKTEDSLSRDEVERQLAENEGGYYYRMALSPGTAAETDGDLKRWTRDTMAELEAQQGQRLTWAAYEHAGDASHSNHAHVHVVVVTNHKLETRDLEAIRTAATEAWERQQAFGRELERDPMQEDDAERSREYTDALERTKEEGHER